MATKLMFNFSSRPEGLLCGLGTRWPFTRVSWALRARTPKSLKKNLPAPLAPGPRDWKEVFPDLFENFPDSRDFSRLFPKVSAQKAQDTPVNGQRVPNLWGSKDRDITPSHQHLQCRLHRQCRLHFQCRLHCSIRLRLLALQLPQEELQPAQEELPAAVTLW